MSQELKNLGNKKMWFKMRGEKKFWWEAEKKKSFKRGK